MSVKVINGQSIPNMPWQDKPVDCNEVIWRDNRNPIIPRNLLPTSNSIFNSAVVPFEGKFASPKYRGAERCRSSIRMSCRCSRGSERRE